MEMEEQNVASVVVRLILIGIIKKTQMSKEVRGIEEALEVLAKMKVAWATVNKIQNSMWETGVAFFGSNHCRVAYYDEAQKMFSIN